MSYVIRVRLSFAQFWIVSHKMEQRCIVNSFNFACKYFPYLVLNKTVFECNEHVLYYSHALLLTFKRVKDDTRTRVKLILNKK